MGIFVYVFCHFLIKLFSVYVSWCCVTKNIEMSLLFSLFVGAVPLLWILSPIDVTLYFNGLGMPSLLPGPSRRLAPVLKCRRVLSFFQRYIVRDISLTEIYRWLVTFGSAR